MVLFIVVQINNVFKVSRVLFIVLEVNEEQRFTQAVFILVVENFMVKMFMKIVEIVEEVVQLSIRNNKELMIEIITNFKIVVNLANDVPVVLAFVRIMELMYFILV